MALAVAPLAGGSALAAQEEEDCRCEPFRIMTRGNVFSMMGDRPRLGVSLDMGLDRDLDGVGERADVHARTEQHVACVGNEAGEQLERLRRLQPGEEQQCRE